MRPENCWEVMNCGRELGGKNAKLIGTCPANERGEYSGANRGLFRGRFCWAVSGTLCENNFPGSFVKDSGDCLQCKFFKQVRDEEGIYFKWSPKDFPKTNKIIT